jgi:hypothetical protein
MNSTIKCGMNLDALKWQVVPTYGIQNDDPPLSGVTGLKYEIII